MRVLVTGGSGAIGRHVAEEFVREGSSVISLDLRLPDHPLGGDVTDVVSDVRDGAALTRVLLEHEVSVVVHLAAALPVLANGDPDLAMDINVRGSQAVVEACRTAGTTGLVHFSSKAVYGRPRPPHSHPWYVPVPEWAPRQPADHYGISELAGEATVRSLAEEHRLPTLILRLGSTFGAGKEERHGTLGWLSRLVDAAVEGRTVVLAHDPGAATDLIYNGDVGRAAVAAATALIDDLRPAVTELNIASGVATPVSEVGAVLASIVGREVVRVHDGGPAPDDVRIVVPPTGVVLDTRRARELLGFTPAFDLRAGLAAFVADLPNRPR